MNKPIAVLDMDDTLIDTHRRYEEGILPVLDEAGIVYDEKALLSYINTLGFPKTVRYFSKLGVPGTDEQIRERMLSRLETLYVSDRVWMMPGVEACLDRLQASGVRLFVLTTTPHRVTDACLRAKGLYDRFEKIWCTEDFGLNKGEPVLFSRVAEAIGCPPEEIFYMDDSTTAIRTAREVGLYTCGFIPPQAVDNAGMEQVAHRCIRSFEEL